MRIGRVLYPIKALGPGERLGIWVQGCERRCEGCANPELQSMEGKEMPLPMLAAMCKAAIEDYGLTGITISGGEPLLQAKELAELLQALRPVCKDVLLFTGYTLNQDDAFASVLANVDVLVDGVYIKERNRGEILRGSDNQVIHFLTESIREKYETYINANKNTVDEFIASDGVVAVGIHPGDIIK
jgi:anaerobic ribonucleoside-triphosphate reductase activating protein